MDLQAFKYHRCALDGGEGILLVDIETETRPRQDREGNNHYYCMHKKHIFAVDKNGTTIIYELQGGNNEKP